MDTKELGNLGERIACEYLVNKGYKIIEKNYRISFGEIDIIAMKKWRLFDAKDKAIHFIEVKTIIGSNGSFFLFEPDGSQSRWPEERVVLRKAQVNFFPEEKVNYKKQKKLIGLCQIWLEKNKFKQDYPYQIDVIGILIDQKSRKAKLHYFPNVIEDF